ncbi:MAG: ABC transporter permease [Treponema sp.]|nr:ABC transporter permease [Treponema sp.]
MRGYLDSFFYTLGFFVRLLRGSLRLLSQGQAARNVLVMQILFTFVEALGLISLLAISIGTAVNVIGFPFLASISQGQLIYPLLIIIITRELGPLLVAFIVIARSATAIATEMAGMVVSHEVEAYISIGIDPIDYLAVPRFIGVTISVFMLNIFFNIFGLAGSFFVFQFFTPMPASVYFSDLLAHLNLRDLLLSMIKSIAFGMIISLVAITQGFGVERASTEIPVAGLRSVGAAYGWCISLGVLFSIVYYILIG